MIGEGSCRGEGQRRREGGGQRWWSKAESALMGAADDRAGGSVRHPRPAVVVLDGLGKGPKKVYGYFKYINMMC